MCAAALDVCIEYLTKSASHVLFLWANSRALPFWAAQRNLHHGNIFLVLISSSIREELRD